MWDDYGHEQGPPEHASGLSERDQKALKRKQANRDSARRSKLRRKQEVEALMVQQDNLHETYNTLTRQLSAAKERLTQLSNLNADLRKQAAEAGLTGLPS